MKKYKKYVILVVVMLVMLGLWKGCTSMANQKLKQSITLHEVKKDAFTKTYSSRGVVVSKKEVRYPIEGMVIETLVHVGDVVKKQDALVKYRQGSGIQTLQAQMEGIVVEMNEQYVTIAEKENVWVLVPVVAKWIDTIKEYDEVSVLDKKGKIEKISSVAHYQDMENYYDVYVQVDEKLSLQQEVQCTFVVEEYKTVYKLPLDAVVNHGDKEYVVLASWLKHLMDFSLEDVCEVEVVGIDGEYAVIVCEDALDVVCGFSSLSLSFIKEMLDLYV